MAWQFTYSRTCKPIVGVGRGGLALATFCKAGEAAVPACGLLVDTAWAALALLRSVIVVANWHAVATYLSEDSRLLQHLLQAVASAWPLLCVAARWAR
jgi:hypothetical protein